MDQFRTSMQGLLHFMAFCFDPTVHDAVRAEFYNSEEETYKKDTEEEEILVLDEKIPEKPRTMSIDSLANVPLPALSSWRIMPGDGLPMAPGATYSSMSPVDPYVFGATYSSINLGQSNFWNQRTGSVESWDGSPIQVGMEDVELDASFRHL